MTLLMRDQENIERGEDKLSVLIEKLRKAGFTEKDLEMISGGNWTNLIQRVLG